MWSAYEWSSTLFERNLYSINTKVIKLDDPQLVGEFVQVPPSYFVELCICRYGIKKYCTVEPTFAQHQWLP